jgi:hypothetical protein
MIRLLIIRLLWQAVLAAWAVSLVAAVVMAILVLGRLAFSA